MFGAVDAGQLEHLAVALGDERVDDSVVQHGQDHQPQEEETPRLSSLLIPTTALGSRFIVFPLSHTIGLFISLQI